MKTIFYLPTRVIAGDGCVRESAALLAGLGTKALLVTGRYSATKNGSLADVESALGAAGCGWELFDRVTPNPTVDLVYDGAAAAKAAGCDFVIGIGGGSPMDAAKAIALLAAQEISKELIFTGGYAKRLPLCCVPTTAGTGSEVTQYSILTNDAQKTKTSLAADVLFPDLALLDARYLRGLSHKTLINTAIDALSHAMEGYLSVKSGYVSDTLALRGIALLGSCLEALKTGTPTKEEWDWLMEASNLGGMVIARTGTTAVHAMGYSLTYFQHIDHGRANGLTLAGYLGLAHQKMPSRVDELLAALGVESVGALAKILDELLGEKEKMTEEELSDYADMAIRTGNIQNCMVVPSRDELLKIYQAAFAPA